MKFSIKDGHDFGWGGLKAKAISSKEEFENASAAYFEVTGSHGKVKTELSDRVYLVLGGEGLFVIDGEQELLAGSHNFSNWTVHNGTRELAMWTTKPAITQQMNDYFDSLVAE